MVTPRDRSSVDAETHRLKNRLRQQRYRARKREEKAKRDGETILPSCSSVTGFPNATNMPLVSTPDEVHSNTDNVGARSGTRSADVDHGETDSSRFKPIVRWQHKQQCNVESVPTNAEGDTINSLENFHTFHLHKIQPLCQMENELTINNLKTQDGYAMKPLDQRECARSNEDIMARRLKNRERQRRYRARKRLEAETMKTAHHITQSTATFLPLATQPSGGGIITERVSRTHCRRDWKQDARKVHLSKEPEKSPPALLNLNLNLKNDNQTNSSSPTENQEKPIPEDESRADNHDDQVVSFNNSESSTIATLGRRDWKVAARTKAD